MFIEKLPDLANPAFAGLVFGQLLMEEFSVPVALVGTFVWATAVGVAAFIGRRHA